MPNPYRSQRERAAYEAGLAAGRAEKPPGEEKQKLTREEVLAMSASEINDLWEQGVLQESMKAWNRGELLRNGDE